MFGTRLPIFNFMMGKERTMPIGRLDKLKASSYLLYFWLKVMKVYTVPSEENFDIYCSPLLQYGFIVRLLSSVWTPHIGSLCVF